MAKKEKYHSGMSYQPNILSGILWQIFKFHRCMEPQFIELGKIRVHFSVILRPSVTVPKIWLRFQSKCVASSQNIPKEIYTGSLCPWQKNSNMQTIAIEVAKCAFKLLDSIFLALSTASISGQREFENTQRVIAAKKWGSSIIRSSSKRGET